MSKIKRNLLKRGKGVLHYRAALGVFLLETLLLMCDRLEEDKKMRLEIAGGIKDEVYTFTHDRHPKCARFLSKVKQALIDWDEPLNEDNE